MGNLQATLKPIQNACLTFWNWCTARPEPVSYFLTRWLFIRALGIVYILAFLSLAGQVEGLIGEQGIRPARHYLEAVSNQVDSPKRYWLVPTLFWAHASDRFLKGSCYGGALLGCCVVMGFSQGPALLLLWTIYLSFCSISAPFLNFQWDILLLETGFLALFFAPWSFHSDLTRHPPSSIGLWLLRFLLFKLMFLSGAVKLLSQDDTWWDLTALNYHYETQPLPTSLGWYAHQLSAWFDKLCVVVMFFIELVVPFFIFLPRRLRLAAFWFLLFLQVVIGLTGNYTFFNLLTIVLCLTLVDDAFLRRIFPSRVTMKLSGGIGRKPSGYFRVPTAVVGMLLIAVSASVMLARLWPVDPLRRVVRPLNQIIHPLRLVNTYGLFARMTTERPEIIIEGSNDGLTWLAYEFKYKPGDPQRRPAFVAPHQPRLDWQMWFAALSHYRRQPWFHGFVRRLLEGSRPVLDLLAHHPFPDQPPRYIRARIYDYHFTDLDTRSATGAWWQRSERGLYMPEVFLRKE